MVDINIRTKYMIKDLLKKNYLEIDKEANKAFLDVVCSLDFHELYIAWLEKDSGSFAELLYDTLINEIDEAYPDLWNTVDIERMVEKLVGRVLPE